MRFFMVLIAVVLASCSGNLKNVDSLDQEYVLFLENHLDDAFSVWRSGIAVEMKYCPDNTCLSFYSDNLSENNLAKITFIYLNLVSTYSYLDYAAYGEKSFRHSSKQKLETLLQSEKEQCLDNGLISVVCVIKSIASSGTFIQEYSVSDEEQTVILSEDTFDKAKGVTIEPGNLRNLIGQSN